MKRFVSIFVGIAGIIVAGLFAAGCEKSVPVPEIPEEYSSWTRLNTEDLDYPVPGHESNFRIIYINEIGGSVKIDPEKGYAYPEGTMIAKAVYKGLEKPAAGASPIMVTVMLKNREHPNARGGWVWMVKNVAAGETTVIDGPFCFTCHAAANESHPYADGNPEEEFRDYVFFAKE